MGYHRKWVGMDDIAHLFVSYQHLFFYPLMALGRWNLYVQGLIYLIMPTWAQTVAWVMVSHAVAGILHVQIVLSHWSMHSYEGRAYTSADDEWYITTMRTTM